MSSASLDGACGSVIEPKDNDAGAEMLVGCWGRLPAVQLAGAAIWKPSAIDAVLGVLAQLAGRVGAVETVLLAAVVSATEKCCCGAGLMKETRSPA